MGLRFFGAHPRPWGANLTAGPRRQTVPVATMAAGRRDGPAGGLGRDAQAATDASSPGHGEGGLPRCRAEQAERDRLAARRSPTAGTSARGRARQVRRDEVAPPVGHDDEPRQLCVVRRVAGRPPGDRASRSACGTVDGWPCRLPGGWSTRLSARTSPMPEDGGDGGRRHGDGTAVVTVTRAGAAGVASGAARGRAVAGLVGRRGVGMGGGSSSAAALGQPAGDVRPQALGQGLDRVAHGGRHLAQAVELGPTARARGQVVLELACSSPSTASRA